MMTGHLPFDDENMGRLLAKIKTGRYRTLPDYLSSDAKDLIKRMLVVDPTKRMTVRLPFTYIKNCYFQKKKKQRIIVNNTSIFRWPKYLYILG